MREGQAVAVPDGDVHHPGGGQLLDQFGPEGGGFGGAAAQAGPAAPGVDLRRDRGGVLIWTERLTSNQRYSQQLKRPSSETQPSYAFASCFLGFLVVLL